MTTKQLIIQAKKVLRHYTKYDMKRYECICTICYYYGFYELKEIVQDTVNIYAKMTKQRYSDDWQLRYDAFIPWDYVDTPEFKEHRITLLKTIIEELKKY